MSLRFAGFRKKGRPMHRGATHSSPIALAMGYDLSPATRAVVMSGEHEVQEATKEATKSCLLGPSGV